MNNLLEETSFLHALQVTKSRVLSSIRHNPPFWFWRRFERAPHKPTLGCQLETEDAECERERSDDKYQVQGSHWRAHQDLFAGGIVGVMEWYLSLTDSDQQSRNQGKSR